MTLLGYLLEENATCDISAVGEKSTARSGIDYAPLTSGIFHSGLAEDTYEVTVYRNEDLLNTDYTLTLHWMQWKTVWWVRQNTNTSRFK